MAEVGIRNVRYWRDKKKREVDFVVLGPGGRCDALECKWNADSFSPRALSAFRALHPGGRNYVVSPQVGPAYVRGARGLEVIFCNLEQWETGQAARLLNRSRKTRTI